MRKPVLVVLLLGLGMGGLTPAARAETAPGQTQPPQPPAGQAQAAAPAAPQLRPPVMTVTFDEAVRQAIQRNTSVRQAAEEILRSQALLRQATASILPSAAGNVSNVVLNTGVSFNGITAVAQDQLTANATLSALVFAPAQWALRAQAAENVRVAEFAAADVRRQIGYAAAQAYLAIIARGRVYDADVRARDVARAHYDLAHELRVNGAGSLLNELRAQQSVSADETLVEQSAFAFYQAEEALGVLLAADGPVRIAGEPTLEVPAELPQAEKAMPTRRADLVLAAGRTEAATRVVNDSWKDWVPTASALFQPQYFRPGTLFSPTWTWRFQVTGAIPIFDSGFRAAVRAQREALLGEARTEQEGVVRQANADVRSAEESVASAGRALTSARAAADQAHQVVDIVNVSFQAGAATNIEVIDAQRAALDADTAVAVAEDNLRQARLALLVALGLFPS